MNTVLIVLVLLLSANAATTSKTRLVENAAEEAAAPGTERLEELHVGSQHRSSKSSRSGIRRRGFQRSKNTSWTFE
ncbi:hypothetical protein B0H16DRAFT_62043 [Mycena metata]|uniref:Uncharacterized protein n=1 Tax=Mycena metata TaxID=1033252 RepID=A0AAD7N014_9AGAR|nr:hypothetical protein B0H16DRAFT_62043 [Mycena metata]